MYTINYICPKCKNEWTDIWDSACDCDCPNCGLRDIEAVSYEEIETKYRLIHSGVLPHEPQIENGKAVFKHGKYKALEKKIITITVEGGVILSVDDIPERVEVRVKDFDTDGAEFDRLTKCPETEAYYIESLWEHQPGA